MKRTLITALIGAFAIALVTTLADAQPRGRGQGGGPMVGWGLQALDLTAEQQQKLQDMRSMHQKDMARLRADAQIAQIELRDLLRQDNPKDADVKAKINSVTQTRGKIMESQVGFRLKMQQVLTPEQRQKFQDMQMERGRMKQGPQGEGRGLRDRMRRPNPQAPQGFRPGNFEGDAEMPEFDVKL